jgi:hypothetical protein
MLLCKVDCVFGWEINSLAEKQYTKTKIQIKCHPAKRSFPCFSDFISFHFIQYFSSSCAALQVEPISNPFKWMTKIITSLAFNLCVQWWKLFLGTAIKFGEIWAQCYDECKFGKCVWNKNGVVLEKLATLFLFWLHKFCFESKSDNLSHFCENIIKIIALTPGSPLQKYIKTGLPLKNHTFEMSQW